MLLLRSGRKLRKFFHSNFISNINLLTREGERLSGLQLKIKRITKGLKAKYIASELKFTPAYISMLENDKQAIPINVLKKWNEILER